MSDEKQVIVEEVTNKVVTKAEDDWYVPLDRFKEVNGRLKALEAEKASIAEDAAKEQGKWKELAEKHEASAKAAESRAAAAARRTAFVMAASGKVIDLDAAWKLASTDKLLPDAEPDDEGYVDPALLSDAVTKLLEKYPFLTPGTNPRTFGGDRSGIPPGPTLDPAKLSSKEKIRVGFEQKRN